MTFIKFAFRNPFIKVNSLAVDVAADPLLEITANIRVFELIAKVRERRGSDAGLKKAVYQVSNFVHESFEETRTLRTVRGSRVKFNSTG